MDGPKIFESLFTIYRNLRHLLYVYSCVILPGEMEAFFSYDMPSFELRKFLYKLVEGTFKVTSNNEACCNFFLAKAHHEQMRREIWLCENWRQDMRRFANPFFPHAAFLFLQFELIDKRDC